MTEATGQDEDLVRLQATVAELRAKLPENAETVLPAYADALMGLAGKLAELGRHDEALATGEEGVAQFRELYAGSPATFGVALASALNNLSNRLFDLGRADESAAASDEAQALADAGLEAFPDQARFVLVSVLMNKAGRAWRTGDNLRALHEMDAAVSAFQAGGEGLFQFLGIMVDALHRNAMALSEAGRWEEALQLRRMTARVFPADRVPAPVLHLLGLTLQQSAFATSRDGRAGEALPLVEEAVELARGLAESQPEQYQLFLAQSLANLAARQHEAHADAEALEAALEAVNTFQEAAKLDAASALVPLASTLETFASILATLGHEQQARNVLAQREQLLAAVKPVQD